MTGPRIVRRPVIHADWAQTHLTIDQRQQLIALVDPGGCGHTVFQIEYDVIDIPLLRVSRYVVDEHGRIQCAHPDDPTRCHPLTETSEQPAGELPAWWQPVQDHIRGGR